MKTVAKIIESFGGLNWLTDNYIRLENPPYMRLVIERIGEGPRGFPAISVAHYYEQNGDAMRDPEIVFELDGEDWCPISFQQDNLGVCQEAISVDNGQVVTRAGLVKDLRAFARHWDSKRLLKNNLNNLVLSQLWLCANTAGCKTHSL